MNILLGFTGSVATVLHPKLVAAFKPFGNVACIATHSAEHFVDLKPEENYLKPIYKSNTDWLFEEMSYSHTSGDIPDMAIAASYPLNIAVRKGGVVNTPSTTKIHKDEDEWHWEKMGDEILHIELRKWADVLVIAPLSANTLGKIANGLCDNLLTSVVRAWDYWKPIIVAPSMNTHMWKHPITKEQIDKIKDWRVSVVDPTSKVLACGDSGVGAMAKIEDITKVAANALYCRCGVLLEQAERLYFEVERGQADLAKTDLLKSMAPELDRYRPLFVNMLYQGESRMHLRLKAMLDKIDSISLN